MHARSWVVVSAELVVAILIAWCVMVVTHEVGHLIGGWLGGAVLQDVDLAPWRLPYSLHRPDPHPLLTLWCGPLLGVVVPFGIAAIVRRRCTWFMADFALLANGTYLGLAWLTGDKHLDTARLLNAGAWELSIAGYCLASICLGYTRFRRDITDLTNIRLSTKPVSRQRRLTASAGVPVYEQFQPIRNGDPLGCCYGKLGRHRHRSDWISLRETLTSSGSCDLGQFCFACRSLTGDSGSVAESVCELLTLLTANLCSSGFQGLQSLGSVPCSHAVKWVVMSLGRLSERESLGHGHPAYTRQARH